MFLPLLDMLIIVFSRSFLNIEIEDLYRLRIFTVVDRLILQLYDRILDLFP